LNFIFLRGSVPPSNEHPEKLYYTDIEKCEDVWTQLFFYLCKKMNANGELLYQGGNRKFVVNGFFKEKWVPVLASYKPKFYPDLIICRGGFDYYDFFVSNFPKSKKVYYGAGKRYFYSPNSRVKNYDLFLVDSKRQLDFIRSHNKNVSLFIKPAALLFKPHKVEKKYDICFIANASQAKIKRHSLLIETFSNSKYKILNLGNKDGSLIKLAKKLNTNVTWNGWSLRRDLPKKISACKVGICCSTNYDSCPRILPEMLCCDIPIVVTDNVNFWKEKYINEKTGIITKEKNILSSVDYVLSKYEQFHPREYYDNNLSIEKSVNHLVGLIEKIL
jgi:glycosyltransferase involved in cell wall biosynthesis